MIKKIIYSIYLLATIPLCAQETDTLIYPFEGLEEFTPENDSLIVGRYLAMLNTDFMEIDGKGEQIPSSSGYHEGYVTYAPDNSFKIFVFEGEGCGAYCSGMYYSVVQFASGKIQENAGFNKIMSLTQKKGTRQFYAITFSWGGGMAGGQRFTLSSFSPEDDVLQGLSLIKSLKDLPKPLQRLFKTDIEENYNFIEVENSNWHPGDIDLSFDVVTGKVLYTYAYNPGDGDYESYIPKKEIPVTDGEVLQVSGSFILRNGRTHNFKEAYKK